MITLRKAGDRGRGNHGWLKSYHSFSFANYYDPSHMGFSHLRVINDDRVVPGQGFSTHGHRNMEILSYVIDGQMVHKDSQGNKQLLPAGEFQLMSAGRGIQHSEYNASNKNKLRFLQIWIEPDQLNTTPGYQQKDFGQEWGLSQVISPSGTDTNGKSDTLKIQQDVYVYQLLMKPHSSETISIGRRRQLYIHMIDGDLEFAGGSASAGDGIKVTKQESITLSSQGKTPVRALVFDLVSSR